MAIGAPWKLPPETMSPRVGEDHRVVGRAVGFDRDRLARRTQRFARRAVDLGRAAQRVGVLHLAAEFVRLVDAAAAHQRLDVGGRGRAGRETAAPRGCATRTDGSSRAARRSTAPRRCRRRARAARPRRAPSASTAVEGWVPLISASPSFGSETNRSRPRGERTARRARSSRPSRALRRSAPARGGRAARGRRSRRPSRATARADARRG